MKRLVCLVLCVAAACVGPARTDRVYEGKAVSTAEAVRSAVETARLAAVTTARDNATGQYLSIVFAESEEEAEGAAGAFDSIQPPSDRSEKLHAELSAVIDDATDVLRSLRVVVRRVDLGRIPALARSLGEISRALEDFVEAHE